MIAVNGSLNERRLGQIHQQTTSTRGPCEKKEFSNFVEEVGKKHKQMLVMLNESNVAILRNGMSDPRVTFVL